VARLLVSTQEPQPQDARPRAALAQMGAQWPARARLDEPQQERLKQALRAEAP
jgi:hypothetical protein